ncbi:hypothetical protein F5B22DRAFT_650299 [Xylaria bambusicola]|uniref:uncharacterized protein n=1 Tax=Xylaria bambusicola TaxID=326684 RepID=UPI002007ADF8|nr:uncharacterized protein F5B22DRAFT_650299 [Xylaria bambusicola]KAI0506817.1 hypothetical protein F5B22DRAFT_650299 [Xylaria bambusicola]
MTIDVDSRWVINALQDVLPEQTLQLLQDHVLHLSSTLRTLYSYTLLVLQRAAYVLQPVLVPLGERAMRVLHDSPDIVFLGFILTLLFIAFQVLLWVQRTISFFTRLAFKAVLWMLLGLALMTIWNRGPEAVIGDLVMISQRAVVYAGMVKDIWVSEYQKYDAQGRGNGGSSFGAGGSGMRSAGFSGRGR